MKTNKPDPAIIVIFGVTGDLVKRKLFPALYRLIKANLLDDNTVIVGITRQNISTQDMLADLISGYPEYDESAIEFLKDRFEVQTMNVTESSEYKALLEKLNKMEEDKGMCMNRLFYLSIPPQVFGPIVRFLGENGLNRKCQHNDADSRLLIEKPFGYDLKSAEKLITETTEHFKEEQIFRIDHYLAKETVQNILNFRFNNAIFESLWNSNHISRIDITATETIGIEGRSIFYEQTGALRDLVQSHLLQLMSVITMEEPDTLESDDIHESKLALLNSVVQIPSDKVNKLAVRGQYQSYKTEVNNPKSNIETFAAIEVSINNPRWMGVPIVIKTGKSLDKKQTEIRVVFKRNDETEKQTLHNSLTFRIQPNEGIDIELIVKKPGLDNELQNVDMDFSYSKFFSADSSPDAYERVLVDAIRGDHTLFATNEEVLASWKIVDPILYHWSRETKDLQIYNDNSSGPKNIPDWLNPNYKI